AVHRGLLEQPEHRELEDVATRAHGASSLSSCRTHRPDVSDRYIEESSTRSSRDPPTSARAPPRALAYPGRWSGTGPFPTERVPVVAATPPSNGSGRPPTPPRRSVMGGASGGSPASGTPRPTPAGGSARPAAKATPGTRQAAASGTATR